MDTWIHRQSVRVCHNKQQQTDILDFVPVLLRTDYVLDGKSRLVKTPWSEKEIPFESAAEIGTKKVIEEYSTIGVVVTTDGSIGEIPRSSYVSAENKVIKELKLLKLQAKQGLHIS